MSYFGLDIGTSSVKAVLTDDRGALVAQASAALDIARPHPGWSEQDPEAWWTAVEAAVAALRDGHDLSGVAGIGLTGQMHGAVLLDGEDRVLRPAILWNDGRSAAECAELEKRWPALRDVTGNIAMPGFTAPKLLWVAKNEPEIFAATAKVLLPKDYVRLRLTGEYATDLSDASGTLWLDVGRRKWSDDALDATGLTPGHMPAVFEGSEPTGQLRSDLAQSWGMPARPVVAAGGGDNAASAVGLGAIDDGDAFVSLGTSGVLWVTTAGFRPNPASAVHAFCHAVPETWHQMGVILSAASAFGWAAEALGAGSEEALAAEAAECPAGPARPMFLPYLSGERTPHNDASARGVFAGIDHDTGRGDLAKAVLDGVGFAVRDCLASLNEAGSGIDRATVVGGGAGNRPWVETIATILKVPLAMVGEAEAGAAYGAARLGRLAASGERLEDVCTPPEPVAVCEPRADLVDAYEQAYWRYLALYSSLREWFRQ